jgi:ribosomal protein S18 acetylase RimI-like enzyme
MELDSRSWLLSGDFGQCRLSRADATQVEAVRQIARATYFDAFAALNTPEDMQLYLDTAFHPEKLRADLSEATNFYWLLEKEGVVIGYIKLQSDFDTSDPSIPRPVLEKRSILLERFYLDARWHGSGLAQAMMNFCLLFSKRLNFQILWLGVWQLNQRALAFYRKWNFEIAGSHVFMMGQDAQADYWMLRDLSV